MLVDYVSEAGCKICPLCIKETPAMFPICVQCWAILEGHGTRPFRMDILTEEEEDEDEATKREMDVQIRKENENLFKPTVNEAQEQQTSKTQPIWF